MTLRLEDLPRDPNGIVIGAWRVLHSRPDFHGQLGAAIFVNGTSVVPVAGFALVRLVAVAGAELSIEPWGELPHEWVPPFGVPLVIPESILARFTARPASPSGEVDSVHSDHKPPPPDARTESVSTDDEAPKRRQRR